MVAGAAANALLRGRFRQFLVEVLLRTCALRSAMDALVVPVIVPTRRVDVGPLVVGRIVGVIGRRAVIGRACRVVSRLRTVVAVIGRATDKRGGRGRQHDAGADRLHGVSSFLGGTNLAA